MRLRRERPATFASTRAGFEPLPVTTGHAYAFTRTLDNQPDVVVLVQRLPHALNNVGGFGNHSVVLPKGRWTDTLTGAVVEGGSALLAELFGQLPVAVLVRSA